MHRGCCCSTAASTLTSARQFSACAPLSAQSAAEWSLRCPFLRRSAPMDSAAPHTRTRARARTRTQICNLRSYMYAYAYAYMYVYFHAYSCFAYAPGRRAAGSSAAVLLPSVPSEGGTCYARLPLAKGAATAPTARGAATAPTAKGAATSRATEETHSLRASKRPQPDLRVARSDNGG